MVELGRRRSNRPVPRSGRGGQGGICRVETGPFRAMMPTEGRQTRPGCPLLQDPRGVLSSLRGNLANDGQEPLGPGFPGLVSLSRMCTYAGERY